MGARVRDVEDFALATFEALRRRHDRAFESLEVGCRLDVGVKEAVDGGGGGLFVNELTRWYGATYFSNDALALPKTRICARFARAFADWVRSGGFREAQEWPEELGDLDHFWSCPSLGEVLELSIQRHTLSWGSRWQLPSRPCQCVSANYLDICERRREPV
uniref:Uncharacterized protein n=2 Tax=Pyricularia oryzae TaxID=318829 RepID=L7JFB2_PYRO1